MLYIVLVLVLAALGLLVTALITATSLWAWVSIGLSVLAGVLLVVDWLRRRAKRSAAAEADKPDVEEEPLDEEDSSGASADSSDSADSADSAEEEQTALLPATGELGDAPEEATVIAATASAEDEPEEEPAAAKRGSAPSEGDPGEEQTEAADLLIVSELEVEVVVVDEYPRYHLTTCAWLSGRDTIPIAVGEARQLGFTPCSRCGPDASLATKHRDTKGKSKSKAES